MAKYDNYLTKKILRGLSSVYQNALNHLLERQGSTDIDFFYYEIWLKETFNGEELQQELETLEALKWLLKFIVKNDKKRIK